MRCQKCGSENLDDSAFCGECGASLTPVPLPVANALEPPAVEEVPLPALPPPLSPPGEVMCPQCGAPNAAEGAWCASCHASLWQAKRSLGSTPAAPGSPQVPVASPAKLCPHCGARIPAWRDTCGQCAGHPQAAAPSPVRERPGCITAYVILGAVGLGLLAVASLVLASQEAPEMLIALIVAAAIQVPVLIGLWRMRNWARVVLLCFQSLGLVAAGLTLLLDGVGQGAELCGGLAGLAGSGYIVYWFASHRADFDPPPSG